MNHDFINDFEQIDDNELDIYGETAQEREAGINHLFDFITGYVFENFRTTIWYLYLTKILNEFKF